MGCKLAKPSGLDEEPATGGYGAAKPERQERGSAPYPLAAAAGDKPSASTSESQGEAAAAAAALAVAARAAAATCELPKLTAGAGAGQTLYPAPSSSVVLDDPLAQIVQAAQMAELAQLAQLQQYQMMGYGSTGGSAGGGWGAGGSPTDERWHCTQCGFWNKPTNTVCGGTGPMGCKAARPETVDPFLQAQALWAAQQASANARAGGASVDPDKWVCECGFANRLINTVCGGGGPLGCKQQRPGCVGAARTPADDGDSWTCSCGFVNSAKNVQCGGKGVLGCKKARAEQVVADLKQYREQMNQRSVSTQARS